MDFESKNLTVPRGKAFFAPFFPGTRIHGPFFELGNTPEFTLTRDDQSLMHYSSQVRGLKTKDEDINISSELNGTVTTDDCKADNMAKWFMSTKSIITTTATTANTENITNVALGGMYQIGESAAAPTGLRSLDAVVVTSATPVTYVLGVDYDLDAELGLLTILATGSITEGSDIIVTYNTLAGTRTQLQAGSTMAEGALKFVSFNPHGADADLFFPRVQIGPNGDLNMMADAESPDWQTIPLSIKALKLGTKALAYRDERPVA